jgi:hypothetical protein
MSDDVAGSLIGAAIGLGLSFIIFCVLIPWWIGRRRR